MLVHADDILMLSTSRTVAVEKMIALLNYCAQNFIKLQIIKCAFMCVNSDDSDDEKPLLFQNLQLNPTTKEVYLGSMITKSVKVEDDVSADIVLRQISVVKFFSFIRCNRNAPVSVKMKCLDACIRSSVLYNSETWCTAKYDVLEVRYRRMLKSLLGIGMTVCNEFVYLELGAISIKTQVLISQWNFWKCVMELAGGNPLSYMVDQGRKLKLKEVKHYDDLVRKYSSVDEIVDDFYQKIRSDIHKKAANNRTKYLTYLKINPELKTPEIYSNLNSQQQISMIGKLRTSSHSLHVEMGRRSGLAREARTCCCTNGIEDEEHFLLQCEIYQDIHQKEKVANTNIRKILEDAKYTTYITNLYQRRKLMATS